MMNMTLLLGLVRINTDEEMNTFIAEAKGKLPIVHINYSKCHNPLNYD